MSDPGVTLEINYTCLYGDYIISENPKIKDFFDRVNENEQFTKNKKNVENGVCKSFSAKFGRGMLYMMSPTILVRSGPIVVGYVDVDTRDGGNVAILWQICASPGYGSIVLAIAEHVMCTPCKELIDYYITREDKDTYKHVTPKAIELDDLTSNDFYGRCGYQKNHGKKMGKRINDAYTKRLGEFLKFESINYEDISTFYEMIDIKTYVPNNFNW
jgi:hypothetical protein